MINTIKTKIRNSFLWDIPVCRKMLHFMASAVNRRSHKRELKSYHSFGYQTLFEAMDALPLAGLTVYPAFGTLLGLVRDGKLIHHDCDLDFAVLQTETFSWEKLRAVLTAAGFQYRCQYEISGAIKEMCFSSPYSQDLGVDFFLFEEIGGDRQSSYFFSYDEDKKYDSPNRRSIYSYHFPAIRSSDMIAIENRPVQVPSNAEQLLEVWYTETWKIPDKHFDPRKNKNVIKIGDLLAEMVES